MILYGLRPIYPTPTARGAKQSGWAGRWSLHGDWPGSPASRACSAGHTGWRCGQSESCIWEWDKWAGLGPELRSRGSDSTGWGLSLGQGAWGAGLGLAVIAALAAAARRHSYHQGCHEGEYSQALSLPHAGPAAHTMARAVPNTQAEQGPGTRYGPDRILWRDGSDSQAIFCPPLG